METPKIFEEVIDIFLYHYESFIASLNFKVYMLDETGEIGHRYFKYPNDTTNNQDEAMAYMAGYVRFDGCMDIKIGQGSIHFCGLHDVEKLIRVLAIVYSKSYEIIKSNGGNVEKDLWGID